MKNDEYRIEEGLIKESELIKISESSPLPIKRKAKSLCKIETPYKSGSGFLIKLTKNDDDFFCLVTNEHIVCKELIEKKEKITFYYGFKPKYREIILDKEKRCIEHFKKDLKIDATVIEILPEDNILKDYFLQPDYFCMNFFCELEKRKLLYYNIHQKDSIRVEK